MRRVFILELNVLREKDNSNKGLFFFKCYSIGNFISNTVSGINKLESEVENARSLKS